MFIMYSNLEIALYMTEIIHYKFSGEIIYVVEKILSLY